MRFRFKTGIGIKRGRPPGEVAAAGGATAEPQATLS